MEDLAVLHDRTYRIIFSVEQEAWMLVMTDADGVYEQYRVIGHDTAFWNLIDNFTRFSHVTEVR